MPTTDATLAPPFAWIDDLLVEAQESSTQEEYRRRFEQTDELTDGEEALLELPRPLVDLLLYQHQLATEAEKSFRRHAATHVAGEEHTDEQCNRLQADVSWSKRKLDLLGDLFWLSAHHLAGGPSKNFSIKKRGESFVVVEHKKTDESDDEPQIETHVIQLGGRNLLNLLNRFR